MATAAEQIDKIVQSFTQRGAPASAYVESNLFAKSHPESVVEYACEVMKRLPAGGTFLDAALIHLPMEDWPKLVRTAIDTLKSTSNEAAESILKYACLQCPASLHPHLDELFELQPNGGTYYEYYPWRDSGKLHFQFLKDIIEDEQNYKRSRQSAWQAMCETRDESTLQYAIEVFQSDPSLKPDGWDADSWLTEILHSVGYHWDGSKLIRLCYNMLFHMQFPEGYFRSGPAWIDKNHSTWILPREKQSVSFGGIGNSPCKVCNGNLHRLLTLSPIPDGLGIQGIEKLELMTCLSCLGWEKAPLFYQHDPNGTARQIDHDSTPIKPQFPVRPLAETVLYFAKTPQRWYWQSWGGSNSRENLNRIGGEPTWIQNADYPNCPSCQKIMPFLFQLDSELQMADGGGWLWGSGGILYGFWCNDCKVSGVFWQCT